jgi:hypothetical protein
VALSATLRLAVTVPLAVGVKVTLIVQFEPAASVVPHVVVCANLAALVPVSETAMPVIVAVPVFVSVTVCAGVVVESVGSDNVSEAGESDATAAAVPLSETLCGEPVALSVMLSAAVTVPGPVGANVTDAVHVAPIAMLLPQVFVAAKLLAFAPPSAMLETVTTLAPEFVIVTCCAVVVEKVREDGEIVRVGVLVATPVPLRLAEFVLPATPPLLSVTVTTAVRVPTPLGVKLTEILQLAPTASVLPQVLVCEKSPALLPPIAIDVIVSAAAPVLAKTSVCTPAEVLTAVLLKMRKPGLGEKSVSGAAPVPLKEIVCGEPVALSAMLTLAV